MSLYGLKELIKSDTFQMKAQSRFRNEIKGEEERLCNASDKGNVEKLQWHVERHN